MSNEFLITGASLRSYREIVITEDPKMKKLLDQFLEYYLASGVDLLQNVYKLCTDYSNYRNPSDVSDRVANVKEVRKLEVTTTTNGETKVKKVAPKAYFTASSSLALVTNFLLIKYVGELRIIYRKHDSTFPHSDVQGISRVVKEEIVRPVVPFIVRCSEIFNSMKLDYASLGYNGLSSVINNYFRPETGVNNSKYTKQVEMLVEAYVKFIALVCYFAAMYGYMGKTSPSRSTVFGILYHLNTQCMQEEQGDDMDPKVFSQLMKFLSDIDDAKPKAAKKSGTGKRTGAGKKTSAKKTASTPSPTETDEATSDIEEEGEDDEEITDVADISEDQDRFF